MNEDFICDIVYFSSELTLESRTVGATHTGSGYRNPSYVETYKLYDEVVISASL